MDIIRILTTPDIQEFISVNKSVDISELALKPCPWSPGVRALVLNQIKSYQKSKYKHPSWVAAKGIVFPAPDVVEQSSSETTARMKAGICPQGEVFADLSAGMGIDTLALSQRFTSGYAIEVDPNAAALLEHNFKALGSKSVNIIRGCAEKVSCDLRDIDLVYIDPQRRMTSQEGRMRKGLFDFADLSPNILDLIPILKEKCQYIMVKASPFLDIHAGIRQLEAAGGSVTNIYVLEHEKQCKEVIYLIDNKGNYKFEGYALHALSSTASAPYTCSSLEQKACDLSSDFSPPLTYLFEPGAALMKSGLHAHYAAEHHLQKLAPMTHLYTSAHPPPQEFGRGFEIIDVLPLKKKELYRALPTRRANISVRNFPLAPDELRKKLQIKDGGDITIFGATLMECGPRLILCRRF